jgi:hypothetical protein
MKNSAVAYMGQIRNAHKVSVQKPKGKILLGRNKLR